MPARIQTNEQALQEASELQQKSHEATRRMQQRLQETREMGVETLEDLYERRRQMEAIEDETNRIHETLDETEQMQAKLGSFFGWLKPSPKTFRQLDATVGETMDSAAASLAKQQPTSARKKKSKSKKMWKKAFGSSHKKSQTEPSESVLEEDKDPVAAEYKPQLDALVEGDKELDDQLDVLGLQLENLTALAEEMGGETKLQAKEMGRVRDNLIDVNVRQYQAVERTRKFIGDNRYKSNKNESIMPKPKLI